MISLIVPSRENETSINKLVLLYGNELLRMCFLYLKDIHLAEDALQDTFIKALNCYGQFNGKSNEKTWLTRIAINVCKDYLRASWWRHIDESAVLDSIPAPDGDDILQDDTLVLEIMKLSPKYKEVILLYYYQSLKTREISEVLHIPESTVSVRLKRAKEKLKSKLKGWYYDE